MRQQLQVSSGCPLFLSYLVDFYFESLLCLSADDKVELWPQAVRGSTTLLRSCCRCVGPSLLSLVLLTHYFALPGKVRLELPVKHQTQMSALPPALNRRAFWVQAAREDVSGSDQHGPEAAASFTDPHNFLLSRNVALQVRKNQQRGSPTARAAVC